MKRKLFLAFRLCFFLAAVLYLIIRKADGNYNSIICPSRNLFNIECYLCGMTRAFIFMTHFKFIEAINYNPLVIVLYPLMAFIMLDDLYTIIKNIIKKENKLSYVESFFEAYLC